MSKQYPAEAKAILRHDEGVHNSPYKDTKNLWTFGVGRLIGASLEQLHVTDSVVDLMLEEDIQTAVQDACIVLGEDVWNKLTEPRKVAMISLLFTLGRTKFAKFRNTIDAIRKEDWRRAGEQVLNSKWAEDVDPKKRKGVGRDDRVAYMLQANKYPKEYDV